jgi:hypothetical protein
MKTFTTGVVLVRHFVLMMEDFPWPVSEKVSELSISYICISIVHELKIILLFNSRKIK